MKAGGIIALIGVAALIGGGVYIGKLQIEAEEKRAAERAEIDQRDKASDCFWAQSAVADGGATDEQKRLASFCHSQTPNEIEASIEASKEAVRSVMKDPYSVRFEDVEYNEAPGAAGYDNFVCGQVNAKNSYGAYTGFRRFYVNAGTAGAFVGQPVIEVEDSNFDELWSRYCD